MSTEAMPRTVLSDFLHHLSTGEDPHGMISVDLEGDMNLVDSLEFKRFLLQIAPNLALERLEPLC